MVHEAGGAAVLVEHDRDVDLSALEFVEQVVDAHRFGREDGGPQERRRAGRSDADADALRNGSRSFA